MEPKARLKHKMKKSIDQMNDTELLAYADEVANRYLGESTVTSPTPTKPKTAPQTDKPVKSPNPFDPRPGKTPTVNPKPKNLIKDEDAEDVGGDAELKAAVMQIIRRNRGSNV